MSKERELNTLEGTRTLTKENIQAMSDNELDQQVAAVLDRGVTHARLKVPLPDDLIGEWVPNDSQAIYEKKLLGFEIDDKYATKHALHSDGSGAPIIGDTIHMVAPKRLMEAVQRKRSLDYEARHGKGAGRKKEQIEEKGYLAENKGGLGTVSESSAEEVNLSTITAANNAAKTT
jgi:hypothetical protein